MQVERKTCANQKFIMHQPTHSRTQRTVKMVNSLEMELEETAIYLSLFDKYRHLNPICNLQPRFSSQHSPTGFLCSIQNFSPKNDELKTILLLYESPKTSTEDVRSSRASHHR